MNRTSISKWVEQEIFFMKRKNEGRSAMKNSYNTGEGGLKNSPDQTNRKYDELGKKIKELKPNYVKIKDKLF